MERRSFFKSATFISAITLLKPVFAFGNKANSEIQKEEDGVPGVTNKKKRKEGEPENTKGQINLGPDHLLSTKRHRRIVVNLDTGWGLPGFEEQEPVKVINANLEYLTGMPGSQVDSIWWCFGEMNYAPYQSKILPVRKDYQKWLQRGLDPLPICIGKCRERSIEVFYTFRINGANDFGDWSLPPILEQHPDWGIPSSYWPKPWLHFNFSLEEVRQYKLAIIREVAERYDFDGIEIDWRAGLTTLPPMHAWEYRDSLTLFMRSVREMLQEVAKERSRPYLLAVRVPENIEGCHYDGLHVERWVDENLIDILALGCKSFEVGMDAFKQLTDGTHIKLYPSMDDYHRASGYEEPAIELYRGAASTFLNQGADGIYAFNWSDVSPILDSRPYPQQELLRRQALCEMGSLDTLALRDKRFVTQRRGGGGWPETAEHFYANTSAFAQLPLEIISSELIKVYHGFVRPAHENYLFLQVGDDVNSLANEVEGIGLRILLSDPAAKDLPWEERIHDKPVRIASMSSRDFTEPPARTIVDQLRVRINGVILDSPEVSDGWLIYQLKPVQLAHGRNVLAFVLSGTRPQVQEKITIEKMEIDVRYAKR
jgi:hypothetical protein